MRLVSFNPYRTLGIPGVTYIKPELMFRQREVIAVADWLLFPEYWQVNALADGLGARIFPSPATYRIGHDKIEMTRVLWAAFPELVPETWIGASSDAAVDEILGRFALPFVVKEPRSSMGRGVLLIDSRSAFRDYAARQHVLYAQEYLALSRDLRVVYVGERVVAAYWRRGLQDFRHNVALGGEVSFEGIPGEALALVEQVAGTLGIDHAGFDLAEVDGRWYILEFNVLFGNEALTLHGIRLGPVIHAYLAGRADEPGRPLWPKAC